MRIYINDRPYDAQSGDLLLSVAQENKSHIGYVCGGNGICQSCFVYVQEGMECLSPPNKIEQAFISKKLLDEGGRLACQAVITKEGPLRVLSRAEHLRRTVVGLNVPGFVTYAQTIGYNVVNQLPSGIANIGERIQMGAIDPGRSLRKIANGLGYAGMFAADRFVDTFSFVQGPAALAASTARGLYDNASGALCTVTGGNLHLPGASCPTHGPQPSPGVKPVAISTK